MNFDFKISTVNCTLLLLKYSGPEVIKKSCSTQVSMNFFLHINVKMPTIVTIDGILTFMSRQNSNLGLSDPEKC